MFNFFDILLSYVEAVFTFALNIIQSLYTAVLLLGSVLTLPQALIGYMPGILSTAVSCTVAVFVIKFIVGR